MHPGGMDELFTLGQFPSKVDMDGFVVMHGAAIQIPKPQHQGNKGQEHESCQKPARAPPGP